MNPLSNKKVLDGIDNSIKSVELETIEGQSYLKVKDLMGRVKYVSSKGLVTKVEDAVVIGGGSGNLFSTNGLTVQYGNIKLGGKLEDDVTEIVDRDENPVIVFEQEGNGDKELEISVSNTDSTATTQHKTQDTYSRIRSTVSRQSDGADIVLEMHTENGATIKDNIHQRGLGDADDYSEFKDEYSYVTKKMLDENNQTLFVNTYEEALPLFTGDKKRTIFITQQSQYNEPFEFFTWIPVTQKAYYLGIDPNYLN